MTNEELHRLTKKFLEGTFSDQEEAAFNKWWETNLQNNIHIENSVYTSEEQVKTALHKRIQETNKKQSIVRKLPVFRIAAAASIVVLVGIAAWWYLLPSKQTSLSTISTPVQSVVPGTNKAILTLSDGSSIILDSATNGILASQSGSNIIKKNGAVVYVSDGKAQTEIVYNSMSTPRGGQYQLNLPDGSKVWLNASSTIRYPTVFGSTREVEISGELYFEIAKDKKHPFIVKSKGQKIEVLGTHFNINAYEDEPTINTTLIEGSVKVLSSNQSILLKPGQTGINGLNSIAVKPADVSNVLAWKNGYFQFRQAKLPELMRQLSRWYDLEVSYEGTIPATTFNGGIKRNAAFTSILEYLEQQNLIVKQNGKHITIISKN